MYTYIKFALSPFNCISPKILLTSSSSTNFTSVRFSSALKIFLLVPHTQNLVLKTRFYGSFQNWQGKFYARYDTESTSKHCQVNK